MDCRTCGFPWALHDAYAAGGYVCHQFPVTGPLRVRAGRTAVEVVA
ncbi:MAG: hypothetical protein WC985_05525 [Thermoplasmata archaeon]